MVSIAVFLLQSLKKQNFDSVVTSHISHFNITGQCISSIPGRNNTERFRKQTTYEFSINIQDTNYQAII